LRYELHEPLPGVATELTPNPKQPKPSGPLPLGPAGAAVSPAAGRKKRSLSDEEQLTRTPSKYVPRLFRKVAPPTPPSPLVPATRKKSSVSYNRRRYQQLRKQKKHVKSSPSTRRSLLSGKSGQKVKRSDVDDIDMVDKDADFPCPKVGIWNYNGEVCIAVGPTPTWACKPNDLVASGKLVICRNKILMSS